MTIKRTDMKDITTKTGDTGTTALRGGVRVEKDDIRIETNGQIDHLNAMLGVVRSRIGDDHTYKQLLHDVQRELMVVMSHVATPDGQENPRKLHLDTLMADMEQCIDNLARPSAFVVPGNNETEAFIHLARTQARTVERRLWTLQRTHPLDMKIMVFFNRLSDFLFVLSLE